MRVYTIDEFRKKFCKSSWNDGIFTPKRRNNSVGIEDDTDGDGLGAGSVRTEELIHQRNCTTEEEE